MWIAAWVLLVITTLSLGYLSLTSLDVRLDERMRKADKEREDREIIRRNQLNAARYRTYGNP